MEVKQASKQFIQCQNQQTNHGALQPRSPYEGTHSVKILLKLLPNVFFRGTWPNPSNPGKKMPVKQKLRVEVQR